ncbi:GNAT family N-acetyltransferase [Oceanobacillus bengalensis]|uniref:N-acetyltransferase n=1 Tax=Oceanobacillus bengalensis TaxID=1435466 RepID=A0A494YZU3_9BACI|nr:GNAT family N-acetyltransferase [Oceanobacillus bengalensis]RKQ15523.1 N-acetyltransferase [Oceanobacillus bengalensis]
MGENIEFIEFYCNDSDMDEIAELYCKTFLAKDYSRKEKQLAIQNITKHANYKGFKGLKAKDGKGNIVGFSYGYTSVPEQFYRQKIAEQLSETECKTWLYNSFEFVELAVSPYFRRLGIASKLHDMLIENIDHRTTVLTTRIDNNPAINLYRKKGWKLIKNNAPVISENNLQVILGKEIN